MVEILDIVIDFVRGLVNVPAMLGLIVGAMPMWFSIAIGLAVCFKFNAIMFKLVSGG